MTPAQKNQLLLEHKFLARVKQWLDGGGSGCLIDEAGEGAVREIWEHWVGVMQYYTDDQAKSSFMHEIDELIDYLCDFKKELS